MKKISIIIPCYNVGKYIEKCFLALEEQTFKNFEVIVVNDCSEDNTLDILNELSKKVKFDLKILNNEVNSGPAISRNVGIKEADSEFITFCDADDWYDKDFLNSMFKLAKDYSADLVLCGYNVIDESGSVQKRPLKTKEGKLEINEALNLESDSLCMMMVKSKIMKETLLPNIRNGEDIAVVPLLMIKSNTIIATSKCLYNYIRRNGSASQKPNIDVVNSLIISFEFTKKHFPKELHKELEYLGIKNLLYSSLITLFSFSYNVKKAKKIVKEFEADFPNWYKNRYFNKLSLYKRIILTLIHYKWYFLVKVIAIIRCKLILK